MIDVRNGAGKVPMVKNTFFYILMNNIAQENTHFNNF